MDLIIEGGGPRQKRDPLDVIEEPNRSEPVITQRIE